MKPPVLLVSRLPEALGERLRQRFDCHDLAQLHAAGLQALAPLLRGMVATGESIVTRELIARLPALEIISVLGVGYDTLEDILNNNLAWKLLILVAVFKSLAMLVALGSGTSGGLLAPMFLSSAAAGAVLGNLVGQDSNLGATLNYSKLLMSR